MRRSIRLVACVLGLASGALPFGGCSLDAAGLADDSDGAVAAGDSAVDAGGGDSGGSGSHDGAADGPVVLDAYWIPPDAGTHDAAADAGEDAPSIVDAADATVDAEDARVDARFDAGNESGADAGVDAHPASDAGADSSVDATNDAMADTTFDTGSDAPVDGSSDALLDSGFDATVDSGGDAGPDAADATVPVDAFADAPGPVDAFADAPADALPDTAPANDGCTLNLEICNDGIDNNCNGLIDCADPECQSAGYTCTAAPLPAGWQPVAYDPVSQVACPSMFDGGASMLLAWDGGFPAAACSCSCEVTEPPSCDVGELTTYYGLPPIIGPPPVPPTCTSGNVPAAVDGSCFAPGILTSGTQKGEALELAALGESGGTCGAVMEKDAAAVLANPVESCALPPFWDAGGCTSGNTCLPPTASPFRRCIEHTGVVACPVDAGFVPVASPSVGPSLNDERTCTGCSGCTGTPSGVTCENGELILYSGSTDCDPDASGVTISVTPADAGCIAIDPAFAGDHIDSLRYTAEVVGEAVCTGTPSVEGTPAGNVTMNSPVTICCTP